MFNTIIWNPDPVIFTIGSIPIQYYGLCWALAFVFSFLVLRRIYVREGIELKYLESLAVYVVLGTMIGARLGHCLFYDFQYYLHHPLEIILPFRFVDGKAVYIGLRGMASHGATIGIIVSLALYALKHRVNMWQITDKLAIVAPLGGAMIRLGNLMNSEIIGKPTEVPWAFVFSRVDGLPRHPSQLYEAIFYIIIFVFVLTLYNRKKESFRPGFFFGLSVFLIFILRFFIEYTKDVQVPFEIVMRQTVGMDMGQLLSLPFIFGGLTCMICFRKPKAG